MLVLIVRYFMLVSVAHTFNVTIHKSSDYTSGNVEPVHITNETYKFEFNMNKLLIVEIRLKNKAPDVVAKVYTTYKQSTVNKSGDVEINTMTSKCVNEDCFGIRLSDSIKSKKSKSVSIGIQLEKENVPCATQIILEGNATDDTKKDADRSLCLNQSRCIVVIDVQKLNVCQGESNQQQPSESESSLTSTSETSIWIYVIPSVIVMCVIILAVYLGVKKFRRRNSDPEATMELKTYSTNEVLYADLSFVNGNSQPPKHEEESPYAEIIGVLKQK